MFLTKINLLYLLYLTAWRCCLLHLIKQNCLLKTSKNSEFDDSGIVLPVFPSRTNNMKLHNISATPKMVENVVTNFDSSKTSSPDCFLVLVLKCYEPELSYMLVEVSIIFSRSLVFQISLVVSVFKNVGGRSADKNYHPVCLLSVVSEVFENF